VGVFAPSQGCMETCEVSAFSLVPKGACRLLSFVV
jgi:hypothetical protein